MKITLIHPPYNLIQEAYGSKTRIKKGNLIPLGIAYLAAVLEKQHKIQVIDASAESLTNKDIIESIKIFKPELIGISATNALAKSTHNLASSIKKNLNIPILVGGPYPTSYPEKVLMDGNIDFIVQEEAEQIIDLFIESLKTKNFKNVPNLGYKENNKIILNQIKEPQKDLDELPIPAFHYFKLKNYAPLPNQYKNKPSINLITSRGCPYRKCAFCFNAGQKGQLYRRLSPERAIEIIRLLVNKYKIKEITFWDDNFLINIEWIRRFCSLIRGLKITWTCYGRVDTVSEEMLRLVSENGCWSIFYGIESGNQDLLDKLNKGIKLEQIEKTISLTHKYGIETRGSFMLAIPGETKEKAIKTIKFAIELDLDYAQFLPTYPEYGTKLYEVALKEGKLNENYYGRKKAAYIPDGYKNAEEIEKMINLAYKKFYFRPKYILKTLKKIKSIDDIKKYAEGLWFMIGMSS